MKLALIIPNNLWFSPYVSIYTNILDKFKIEYEIIFWNRDGSEKSTNYSFNEYKNYSNIFLKYLQYYKFASHIKSVLKKNYFDKLIIFGPQIGIFLQRYLEKDYKKKYILDYRDLSIEQMYPFKKKFNKTLSFSHMNVISSPGFKSYLPKKHSYILSHNFDIERVMDSLNKNYNNFNDKGPLYILTIGGIRDFSSNIEVVEALANKPNIQLKFVGKGLASNQISEYVKKKQIRNVEMKGFYKKEDEKSIIENSSFLNIFYPVKVSHTTALSNRFYNGLIYRKPMIVTKNSIQGDLVEKYKLGISVENCNNLEFEIYNFINNNEFNAFDMRCKQLLLKFINDYEIFQNKVMEFINT